MCHRTHKKDEQINNQLKIALISGGSSAEASVSRVSAAGVLKALQANYRQVENFELESGLGQKLHTFAPDVVFPVLHGPPGEDGTLQGFLEIEGYAYVGSDVKSSATAMNKILSKHVFQNAGLPLARQTIVYADEDIATSVSEIIRLLGDYVVVKPATQGSALGVTLIDNENQLADALVAAFEFDPQLLIEERINGKEITVGVIDLDEGPVAFPVIEIITASDAWYDFEHRYTAGLSDHIVPAVLTETQTKRLQDIAIKAHQSLGCRDISRADFVVPDDNHEILLEVNTLPGMTPTSLYPDGARAFGLSFEELVSLVVERAADRR